MAGVAYVALVASQDTRGLVSTSHTALVTDTLENVGQGVGGSDPEVGYSWYAGI